jgi:hypothetical protein
MIDCPVDLYPRQEAEIERLTRSINQERTAAQKAPYAQSLLETVDILLDCEAYDEDNSDCRLCRNFSELRQKTAALVVKAGQIDKQRRS